MKKSDFPAVKAHDPPVPVSMANLLSAAESGIKHGAIGFLNTNWGDE